ncbi:MAG: FAD-dependent oxidoreductase, partial [Alphaproteobacteria bacterium]
TSRTNFISRVRATMQEIYPGLVAKSQNRFPSLKYDIGSVNQLASPIFGAGFYYKTFFEFGHKGWMFFEGIIRKAAGIGKASRLPDPDTYEKTNAHCDVLIVGGGPSGMIAALEAGRAGAKIMLVEQMPHYGGQLLSDGSKVNGETPAEWVGAVVAELHSRPNVTLLNRTTAWGYYDGNSLALTQRVSDHLSQSEKPENWVRQRLWRVTAEKVVLATGALERPLLFKNNDRPGVMLAGAVRTYLKHYGVTPGKNVLCLGQDDSIYETAFMLKKYGVEVRVADLRNDVPEAMVSTCLERDIALFTGVQPLEANGRLRVNSVRLTNADGKDFSVTCDTIAMSGGWTPSVHLASQAGGKPVFDRRIQAFVPGKPREDWVSCGAINGRFETKNCFVDGLTTIRKTLNELGVGQDGRTAVPVVEAVLPMKGQRDAEPLLNINVKKPSKAFVDFQHDVTAKDIALAHQEGFVSVEHLKRYTTLGMATDQGKTSNILGLALMAQARSISIEEAGTTTFRAPFTPVTMGSLVGREVGQEFLPIRRTPMHAWHEDADAVFVEAGTWLRPHYYPIDENEDLGTAYIREAEHVRSHCGICDVSTLGKIDVQGPDAATFLNRIYANGFAKLPIGKARYGIMLREDGIPFDDGTTTRIGENQFYLTTTTGEAAHVMHWLEHKLDVVWPDLKVALTSVTDQWANMAIAGPKSRMVLEKLLPDVNLSDEQVPFMACLDAEFENRGEQIPIRLFRISFSGELGYELATPSMYGETLWTKLMALGIPEQIIPYGLEAMGALRVEKGFITHADMDGRVTIDDLGYGRMASKTKAYIGKEMLNRPGFTDADRPKFVGIIPLDPKAPLAGGGHIIPDPEPKEYSPLKPAEFLGHISSMTYSPVLKSNIGLGFVRGGVEGNKGKTLYVADPVRGNHMAVKIVPSDMISDAEKSNGVATNG